MFLIIVFNVNLALLLINLFLNLSKNVPLVNLKKCNYDSAKSASRLKVAMLNSKHDAWLRGFHATSKNPISETRLYENRS